MPTSCNLVQSSTLQFPNGNILNEGIIVASFFGKGSKLRKQVVIELFFIFTELSIGFRLKPNE